MYSKFLDYITWLLVLIISSVLLFPQIPGGQYIFTSTLLIAATVLVIYYRQVRNHLSPVDNKRYTWSIIVWFALGILYAISTIIRLINQ